MALNPSIILAGQPVDVIGSMSRGNQLAAETNAIRDQNALRQVYQTQGAGLLQGNQASLNALAAIDPSTAMGLQNSFAEGQKTQRQIEILNAEERRAATEFARTASEAEKAAAAAEVEKRVKMLVAAPTPEVFDRLAVEGGRPDLVGQFANRQSLAAAYMTEWSDILKMAQGPEPAKPQSTLGKFYADKAAGLLPADAAPPQEGTNVTVNNGGGSDRQVFEAVATSADSARSAVSGLRALQEAKTALDGGIISGAFADNVLALQKIGAAIGVVDPTTIQNTETFRSAIAPQVAAMLKATVGSAQISNADREFAEKAAGGSITLDEGSIRRLVDIMERGSRASIASHMERLNAVYPETPEGLYRRERALFSVTMPDLSGAAGSGSQVNAPAPAGSTPLPQTAAPLPPDLQSIFDKYSTPSP